MGSGLLVEWARISQTPKPSLVKSLADAQMVLDIVCKATGKTREDIHSRTRCRMEISLARQICMYVLREQMGFTIDEIALAVKRDHSTVSHGIHAVKQRMRLNPALAEWIIKLMHEIESQKDEARRIERTKHVSSSEV
jgi:chromosomal replication initiator protein